jgi:hypothetical protein
MVKVYLDLKGDYITRLNVLFPEDFLRICFDVALNSAKTRRYMCKDVIEGPYSAILDATDDCEAALDALPTTDGSLMAIPKVAVPCTPSSRFSLLKDPRGRFMCQTSSQTLPSDLFTEYYFALTGSMHAKWESILR